MIQTGLRKVRAVSYDSAAFEGSSFVARYSTDTGFELRIRSELDGLPSDAFEGIDTTGYAKLWGLANFGRLFAPLLPIRLDVKALSLEPVEEERWRAWFIGILSESFHFLGLPAELDLTFSGGRLAPRGSAPDLDERAVLMSGGGKDSAVSGEILKSLGVPFSWYSLREEENPAARGIARVSGDSPLIMASISPLEIKGSTGFKRMRPKHVRRLYRTDRQHVRRTRWISLIGPVVEACLVAEATRSRYVLIGNDRSANAGNGIHIGNLEVNHQYSKSYALERELAPFLEKYLHPGLTHASLLMPFYEAQIGRMFASYPRYFPAFRSCNRRTTARAWCCECPKCAFVYLLLSAFVDEEAVSQIFQADLLAEPGLAQTFMDLCGRGGHKPLECVGEPDESLLALYLASNRRARPLLAELEAILPGAAEADGLEKSLLGAYNDENGLPAKWNDRLRELVETFKG